MAVDRTLAYAEALFGVARAEGTLGEVEDELFRFSQDLLGGRASPTTVALVSMVVGTGRARSLPTIIHKLVEMSAAEADKEVAEVRSAIPLTDDQRERLAKALGNATGKRVEVKVVVDPSVLGGIVAQVGDTVIDGSVRSRLDQLKHAF